LYLNGDQGVCETTGTDADTIVTHSGVKQWAADEAIGSILVLNSGKGSDQPQKWRSITDNTAIGTPGAGQTTFTVSQPST